MYSLYQLIFIPYTVFFRVGTFISSFLQNNIKTNQLEIDTDIRTFRTTAKLREPRDLFALPKELDCPQQAPRWPTECQVSDLDIKKKFNYNNNFNCIYKFY